LLRAVSPLVREEVLKTDQLAARTYLAKKARQARERLEAIAAAVGVIAIVFVVVIVVWTAFQGRL